MCGDSGDGNRFAEFCREQVQQPGFEGAKWHRPSPHERHKFSEQQGDIGAQPKALRRQATSHAVEDAIDPGKELTDIERLGDIVLGKRADRLDLGGRGRVVGERDDGEVGPILYG